jgi:glycosyltransferase involved in cell wall biosynthesis
MMSEMKTKKQSTADMRRHVLLMVPSFHQGGSERQGVQLARLLSETGRYRVTLACLDRSGVLLPEAEALGLGELPEFRLNSFYDRNMVTQLRRCMALLKAQAIDVVQTFDFYTNIFGLTAAALARVPLRIGARRNTIGHFTPTQRWIERRAFQLAQVVAANSEAVRQELIRDGVGAGKIVTLYNGLDANRVAPIADLSPEERLRLVGLPTDAERIVTIIANLRSPYKDHAMFMTAARIVTEVFPEATFVLAGEGPLIEDMRLMARELGIENRTFLLGRCMRVAELLAASEVCVLSSKGGEGFSNAITEYMAAARPVVATDVGGAREAIVEGESGWIVPAGDYTSLAARIIELLQNPAQARAMGARGRQIVKQKFSCEAQLEHIESLYDRQQAKFESPRSRKLDGPVLHSEGIK